MVKEYVKPEATVEVFSTENYVAALCDDIHEWEDAPSDGVLPGDHFLVDGTKGDSDGVKNGFMTINGFGNNVAETSSNNLTLWKDASGNGDVRWAWWVKNLQNAGKNVGDFIDSADESLKPFKVIRTSNDHWIASGTKEVITVVERS